MERIQAVLDAYSAPVADLGEGEKNVGYFCSYTPLELIHAADAVPRRILPPTTVESSDLELQMAAAHLPSFVCPYLKRAMEYYLSNPPFQLQGIIHAYTCDATCGTFNIWQDIFRPEMAVMLHQPYGNRTASTDFYMEELNICARALEELTGVNISDAGLRESIRVFNHQRGMLRELSELRACNPPLVNPASFLRIVTLCQTLPLEEANTLLERILEITGGLIVSEPGGPGPVRVLVSGSILCDISALEMIEKAGGRVVTDDLCTGYRWFADDVEETGDPWQALAGRYLGKVPCPARSWVEERLSLLLRLISEADAEAVVFAEQKFCDPHLADIPQLRASLEERAVPSIFLETEEKGTADEQWITRLETLFQLVRMRESP